MLRCGKMAAASIRAPDCETHPNLETLKTKKEDYVLESIKLC